MSHKSSINRKTIMLLIIATFLVLLIILFFKYFLPIINNWWTWKTWLTESGTVVGSNFSYSGTIESLFWGILILKKIDWSNDDYILNPDSILLWIDWNKALIGDIKKWFWVEIVGRMIDKTNIIEKLTILNEVNIVINSPANNEEIISPAILKWEARTYENTINYVISDASWKILGQWIWTTNSSNSWKFWTYLIKAAFRKSTTKTGSIEVFEVSEKDGSIINSVKTDIIFWKAPNWSSL